MSKLPMPVARSIRPRRRKRKLPLFLSILVVGGVLAPLAVEGSALLYARWCEVLDGPTEVRTPVIDWIGDRLSQAHDACWQPIAPSLEHSARDPHVALPVAMALIVVAMVMLKR
jgi:hypothetical protein